MLLSLSPSELVSELALELPLELASGTGKPSGWLPP
jgi:hypothetical protein